MPTSISLLVAYPKELIRAGLWVMLVGSSVKIVAFARLTPHFIAYIPSAAYRVSD